MPTRPAYWNIEHPQLLYVFVVIALAIFGYGLYGHYRQWRQCQGRLAFDRPLTRLKRVAKQALLQERVLRDRFAGVMHLTFFWSLVFLFIGTLVAMTDEDFGVPVMRGQFYLWFQSLALDVAGLVGVTGLGMALYRRQIVAPKRLIEPRDRHNRFLDLFIPWSLLLIFISGFLIEGLRIQVTHDVWGRWSPVGYAVGMGWSAVGLDKSVLGALHATLWWFHLALASTLIALIPYSKLMHILSAPASIYFASLDKPVSLKPIDFESEATLGVRDHSQWSAMQALAFDSCTECGRCQDVCPAYAVGQPISPKAVILDLKHFIYNRENPLLSAKSVEDGREQNCPDIPPLILAANPDSLWSCVTCYACVRECPVLLDHVGTIVDLRRYLVMEQAEYPKRLQEILANLEARGTPFRGVRWSRTQWCQDLNIPRISDVGRAEFLYWVGCAAAFDERDQQIARAFSRLLQRAGVDFAILGEEETCTGDVARRCGSEYLFASLARQNVEVLNRYGVTNIVTACPHCFNTLKNDYPQFGGLYRVFHHTELIAELIAAGRLEPKNAWADSKVTFHDPCYLGRCNGVFDPPRTALRSIANLDLVEMAQHRERSFCCGAGSGHFWMEEIGGGRISHARTAQVIATGAQVVATSCPFCMVTIEDGVRTCGGGRDLRVLDIAELIEEATRP